MYSFMTELPASDLQNGFQKSAEFLETVSLIFLSSRTVSKTLIPLIIETPIKKYNAALRCEWRLAILERSESAKRYESLLIALLAIITKEEKQYVIFKKIRQPKKSCRHIKVLFF